MFRTYESVEITYDLKKAHRVGLVRRIYPKDDTAHISFLCNFFYNTMLVESYIAPNFCHKVIKDGKLPLIILDNAIEIWYDELEFYI